MSGLPPRPAFPPATLPHTPHADDVLLRRWGALRWLGQPCQPAGQFHLLPLPTMLADYHWTWRLQCIMSALSHHCLYWCDLLYAAAADCDAEGDGTFHEPQKCCIKTSINITGCSLRTWCCSCRVLGHPRLCCRFTGGAQSCLFIEEQVHHRNVSWQILLGVELQVRA